jgi:hypothetical protein
MIKSLNISSVATFDTGGICINDLKKANFIYGTNGCGKTTISNYLYDQSDSKFATCSVSWVDNIPIKTLVYNKAFRERNFETEN